MQQGLSAIQGASGADGAEMRRLRPPRSRWWGAFRFLLVRCEPCALGLSEALRGLSRFKAQDRLAVIDCDDDRVSRRTNRIVSRRDIDVECDAFSRVSR
jgi:hypothetical protein